MKTKMKRSVINGILLCLLAVVFAVQTAAAAYAGVAGDGAFQDMQWEELFRVPVLTSDGTIQSICVTDEYIIAMENVDDSAGTPDIVTAYYRNDRDAEGKKVEQYAQALQNSEQNWEHCNGMAWNPNTDLIYVAPYTNINEDNRGCIFVMDPHTLEYLYSIKITDEYNILGIAYDKEENRYIMQSNTDGQYRMLILDEDFNITADLGASDLTPGTNSQDCCVMGDYVINSPLTYNMGIGEYIHVYSLSRNAMVYNGELGIPVENAETLEPESFAETEPGVLLMDMSVHYTDGTRGAIIYQTVLPYQFYVLAVAEGGTISGGSNELSRGSECTVTYTAEEGKELAAIEVDHESVEIGDYQDGYTFRNLQDNHTIEVHFKDPAEIMEETPTPTETATPTPEETGFTEDPQGEKVETVRDNSLQQTVGTAWNFLRLHWAKILLVICTILLVIVGILYYRQLARERDRKRQASRAARESARRQARRRMRDDYIEEDEEENRWDMETDIPDESDPVDPADEDRDS